MNKKTSQINELLREELALLIEEQLELPGVMITVTSVVCSEDLNHARISVSVLPEKFSGTALKSLRKYASTFSKVLRKNTRLRHIPRFDWRIDDTEVQAAKIDELFKQI